MSQAANLLSNDPLLHNLPLDHAAGELTSLSKSLLRVLAQRHSDRQFSSRTVPLALLAHLLWAALGVNRQETGQRTAPSTKNWQVGVPLHARQAAPAIGGQDNAVTA